MEVRPMENPAPLRARRLAGEDRFRLCVVGIVDQSGETSPLRITHARIRAEIEKGSRSVEPSSGDGVGEGCPPRFERVEALPTQVDDLADRPQDSARKSTALNRISGGPEHSRRQ